MWRKMENYRPTHSGEVMVRPLGEKNKIVYLNIFRVQKGMLRITLKKQNLKYLPPSFHSHPKKSDPRD
jgi:hypothetical protein